MGFRFCVRVCFLVLLLTAAAQETPRLAFSHKIGTDWPPDVSSWMNFVAISADGRTVAGNGNVPGATGSALGFWTFPEGDYLRSVAGIPIAISADFRYLSTHSDVRDLQTGKTIFRVSGASAARQPDILTTAAFSPNGQYVALSHAGNRKPSQITVLSTADGSLVASFGIRHTQALAFHPDNQTLASGHWNNVTLWNARTGERQALLMSPQRPPDPNGYDRAGRYIVGLAFSPDGEFVAAGSDDGELQIWRVTTRTLLHTVTTGWQYVSDPAFSPDGRLVAAGTYGNGTAYLIDVASGKILSQVQLSMFGCGSVAFSPDGRYLIAPSNGGLLNNGKHETGGTIRVLRLTP